MASNNSNKDDENSIDAEIELESWNTPEIYENTENNEETFLGELDLENEKEVLKNIDDDINKIATEKEAEGEDIINNIDERPIIIQSSTAITEEYIIVGSELHKVSESAAPKEKQYQTNDYVVVHYNKQYFPGVVTEIIENEKNGFTYLVNAMERVGKKWQWPKRRDEILYEECNKKN
ncbi:hypothetical protein PPYR_06142 [Photinus pyralis]|uniref:Uncharacterized protein n=1 Tax=Photinus pyralis TaxID=7054 RepID=A0A5N4ASQ6_PHOPY|nr:hypothetical protein PPYR_06142 [Photinus pyralis]